MYLPTENTSSSQEGQVPGELSRYGTGLRAGGSVFHSRQGQDSFSISQSPDRLWSPTIVYLALFPQDKLAGA
jgi:hypothetical protein